MATPIWNQRNLTSPPIVHLPVSFTLSENGNPHRHESRAQTPQCHAERSLIFHRILSKCEESEKNMKWFRECKAILNCFDRLRKMKIEDITAAMQPQTDEILSEHLLEKSCRWYTVLYPWLQCLPKLEADWLPEEATLPNSVEEALGSKLVELRNIASQRGTKKENVKKSILDKIFGMRDSEDMLPQLVL
ncbi:hypothetical protein BSL78_02899, partial [Apostichopus japonicus]